MTEAAQKDQDYAHRQILLVDDSRLILHAVGAMLKREGIANIETASDGLEALEKLRHKKYDLVLSDIEMPNMGGLALLLAMKSDPALQSIPVVMMSGNNAPEDRTMVKEKGALGLLGKPFLFAAVRTILDQAFSKATADEPIATRGGPIAPGAQHSTYTP